MKDEVIEVDKTSDISNMYLLLKESLTTLEQIKKETRIVIYL